MATVLWKHTPDEHDYPAAASYLSLLAEHDDVDALIGRLQKASSVTFKAKDILRAARLPLLPRDNVHVASDLAKVTAGTKLSPVLMVRGVLGKGVAAQVADGYHRVCASYYTDENTDIPTRIVDPA